MLVWSCDSLKPIRQIQNLKHFAYDVDVIAETVSLDHEVIHVKTVVEKERSLGLQCMQSCKTASGHLSPYSFYMSKKFNFYPINHSSHVSVTSSQKLS